MKVLTEHTTRRSSHTIVMTQFGTLAHCSRANFPKTLPLGTLSLAARLGIPRRGYGYLTRGNLVFPGFDFWIAGCNLIEQCALALFHKLRIIPGKTVVHSILLSKIMPQEINSPVTGDLPICSSPSGVGAVLNSNYAMAHNSLQKVRPTRGT